MSSQGVVLTSVEDRIGTVTINRPDRRNALSADVTRGLRRAVQALGGDDDVRVIVLTGAGDQAFCAGADLATMGSGAAALELHDERGQIAALFEDLWSAGKPTIARVRGFALAGGFGLALACDLLVAADDAVFGTPEIGVGLWPLMITVPMLRSMSPKRALDLMLTGRRVDASEGERLGFVSRVVPVADLDTTVATLAGTLAGRSPAAVRLGRDAFYRVVDQAADTALSYLHAQLTVLASTDDAREGMAAFIEKRPPRWSGH